MQALVKQWLRRSLPPSGFARLAQWHSRTHQKRYLDQAGVTDLSRVFVQKHGMKVRYGPFAGMTYTERAAAARVIIPKLLGSFEQELHSILESAFKKNKYQTIIDVGCAEGYYSTGFALRTKARVLAFDVEPRELALARGMARTNGVEDRIEFGGWCTAQNLVQQAQRPAFILADCEGYERELFDRELASALSHVDLLIELHGDASVSLPTCFAASHDVTLVNVETRDPFRFQELSQFDSHLSSLALCEHRSPSQQWLWAESRMERI